MAELIFLNFVDHLTYKICAMFYQEPPPTYISFIKFHDCQVTIAGLVDVVRALFRQ